MSKAVLVMDMPEGCTKCPIFSGGICSLQDEVSNYIYAGDPNELKKGCPFRLLPEKKSRTMDGRRPDSNNLKAWMKGWNDCLGTIENIRRIRKS